MNDDPLTPSTIEAPPKVLIYGPPGVGKSTIAATIPNAIVLHGEDGTKTIPTVRLRSIKRPDSYMPATFGDVLAMLMRVRDDDAFARFGTLVIDTIDGIEALAISLILHESGSKSLNEVGGGWGNGAQRLFESYRELMLVLEQIQAKRRMTVVITAHATVAEQGNPTGDNFSQFVPAIGKKSWPLLFGWCDAVLLAAYDMKVDDGKMLLTGERSLKTTAGNGWAAKNRYGFPPSIPLKRDDGWAEVQVYLDAPKRIRAEVEALTAKCEPELRTKLLTWLAAAGLNASELAVRQAAIIDRLKVTTAKAKPKEVAA